MLARVIASLRGRLRQLRAAGVNLRQGDLVTEADVVAAYRLLLGRVPDPDGWRTFSSLVDNAPPGDLVSAFLCSEEFRRSPLHDVVARREGTDLDVIEIGDHLRLFVSPHDSSNGSMHRAGSYEPHLVAALDRILRPGHTVCIVGGNIGYHVVRSAYRVGPSGRVLVFEARPDNVDLLRRNVALNGLDNVLVLSFAVAAGRALYRYVPAQGTNGYIEPCTDRREDVDALRDVTLVQSLGLDEVAPLLGNVDVLQLDVEGAEGLVLRGAAELLRRCRPVVFFELSPGQLERVSRMSTTAALEPLAALGYRLAVIEFGGTELSFDTDGERLAAHARAHGGSHVDVCATPTPRATGAVPSPVV